MINENSLNFELLKKIHNDLNKKCKIAITKNWSNDFDDICFPEKNNFYDRFFTGINFFKEAKIYQNDNTEDTYFSINCFRHSKKSSDDTWHLNCFALDFDYYKIDKYKSLSPLEMYENHIKKDLEKEPTAVVDSGRGLYLIYQFKHCSKLMNNTYLSIYKSFINKLGKYGLDPKAMNLTQIIRLPGTLNTKSLTTVEVLKMNETEYKISDFYDVMPYSREEVESYKKIKRNKNTYIYKEENLFSLEKKEKSDNFRNDFVDIFLKDITTLILSRNKNQTDGYREILIYLVRRRCRWANIPLDKELDIAKNINALFSAPLSEKELINQAKPCGLKRCQSIKRTIELLEITSEEQMTMKVLCNKSLKDNRKQKSKRKIKLLNMTEKQRNILKRRTKVCKLTNDGFGVTYISKTLNEEKSTISRDREYIKTHASKFIKKLKDAMIELQAIRETYFFKRLVQYDVQKSLLEWLKLSMTMIE